MCIFVVIKRINQEMEKMLKLSEEEQFVIREFSSEDTPDIPQRLSKGVIILCLNGHARITVNFERCKVEKYQQLFILPHSIVTFKDTSDDFKVLCFFFSTSMMDEACFRIDSELFSFLVENFMHTFSPELFQQKKALMELLLNIYEDKENKYREKMAVNYLQNYFLDTLDKVYYHISNNKVTKEAGRKNILFKKFVRSVHENYMHSRDVNFYANELNISTRYLSAITQTVDNSTAKDFIDNCVVQEIKFLLFNTELSIQEIADRLNFTDQSNLGRFFKNKTRISPSEYRKSK